MKRIIPTFEQFLNESELNEVAKPIDKMSEKEAYSYIDKLFTKRPKSNAAVSSNKYRYNHKSKELEISVTVDRAARHPREYGERGEKMEALSNDWLDEFEEKVVKPIEKLGITVSMHSF